MSRYTKTNLTCRRRTGPAIWLLLGEVPWHNSWYKHTRTTLPYEKDPASSKSRSSGNKKKIEPHVLICQQTERYSIRLEYKLVHTEARRSVAGDLAPKFLQGHRSRKSMPSSARASSVKPSNSLQVAWTSYITGLMTVGRSFTTREE